jgi:hypothetical protein
MHKVHTERRPWVHADITDTIVVRLERDLDSMIAEVRTALDRGDLDYAYTRLLEGTIRVQLAACRVEELQTGQFPEEWPFVSFLRREEHGRVPHELPPALQKRAGRGGE